MLVIADSWKSNFFLVLDVCLNEQVIVVELVKIKPNDGILE